MPTRHPDTGGLVTAFLQRLAAGAADGSGELFHAEFDCNVQGDPRRRWVGRRSLESEVRPYFRALWSAWSRGRAGPTWSGS